MTHYNDNGYIYLQDGKLTELIGPVNKTEVERIDDSTVADVSYQFDLDAGVYVELSRVTRNEPLPPVPPSTDEQLATLKSRLAATELAAAETSTTLQQLLESLY